MLDNRQGQPRQGKRSRLNIIILFDVVEDGGAYILFFFSMEKGRKEREKVQNRVGIEQ
jgi:hypothetical protein